MKSLFFILTLCLSMLFSPFVFAAGLIANAPELPGFEVPVFVSESVIVAANCRDVFETSQQVVIAKLIQINSDPTAILETGSKHIIQDTGTFNHWEAVHRHGIGLVLSPMTANHKQKRELGALAG